jgi:hypothetical protein
MGCSRGCSRTFRLYDAVLTRLPRPPRAAYYILALVIAVLAALLFIYHKQITTWLRPAADWMKECVLCFVWTWGGASRLTMIPFPRRLLLASLSSTIRSLPAGFLIPVAVMTIQSFPPLFGQEVNLNWARRTLPDLVTDPGSIAPAPPDRRCALRPRLGPLEGLSDRYENIP